MVGFGSGRLRAALVLLAATTAACSDESEPANETEDYPVIKIGALADRTGPSASTSYEQALELAERDMNAALERASIPIRFDTLVEDSRSAVDVARDGAVRLINDEEVKGLVADVSANTVAVNQLNYDSASPTLNKVPITCYACSSAFVNDPNVVEMDPVRQAAERDEENWLYRVFFNGKYEAAASVRIMLHKENGGDVNGDGNFKVTVYAGDDNFGQSSARSLTAAVDQLLGDQPHSVEVIYIPFTTDPTSYDWGADLERLVDERNETTDEIDGKPDAIFLALLPLLASGIVSARSDLGYTEIPMQSVTAFRRNYILRAIGDKAVGLEGDSPRVVAQDESGETYTNAYLEEYRDVPEMLSAHVYDCAMTLMLGSLKAAIALADPAGVDPADVRDQMLSVTDTSGEEVRSTAAGLTRAVTLISEQGAINYAGASGVFPWDAVGDTFPELVHWVVVNDGTLRFNEEEAYRCSPEYPTCQLIE
jgi:hypothetical protein